MTVGPEAQAIIDEEERTLQEVLESLREQIAYGEERLRLEGSRAQELTSELVAANRAEDKAMLASDEAVSHGLRDMKRDELLGLKRMMAKPYFARLVVEEEDEGGASKQFEYRIGFAANSDCRIIDWRKAPISKLYYEYRENEEYSEEIQGGERNGRVVLRNSLDIENGVLKKISCRYGTLLKGETGWTGVVGGTKRGGGARTLPHILSLITPEQFRLITEEATTAILIQGIAGSGKTTVALHRLAWLLHKDNADIQPEQTAVIVLSRALQRYVSGTLPSIDIHGVPVLTFSEWAARSVSLQVPQLLNEKREWRRRSDPPGAGIERVKRSLALLRVVEEIASAEEHQTKTLQQVVLAALSQPKRIIELDETKLLDAEVIARAHARVRENIIQSVTDSSDDALFVRVMEIRGAGVRIGEGAYGRYRHIVVDEVQDMSPAELAAVMGAVQRTSDLTFVGDTAQKIDTTVEFPGWEKLMRSLRGAESVSKYLSLTVSHRSTLPIMQLGDYVQSRQLVTEGRAGRVPIWFRCADEERGVPAVVDWLNRALERYPDALTAVICATPEEARYAISLLIPTFRAGVRLGSDADFSFDEGIVVTDVAQVKGLEFTNVLLWNPSRRSYPRDERSRNLLYIGITRAEENLALVTWDEPSTILPDFGSKLLRNYDLIPDPVQEEEREPELA